jgi:putative transposase
MYSEEQYRKALEVYEETKSVTKTITILGYPARRQTLYNWINRKRMLPEDRCTFCGYNTPEHPRHPPIELKLEILHRCFELGEDVQLVSNEVGYSTASIYNWRRKYIQKGAAALMNASNERARGKLTEGKAASSEELDELKAKIQDMQLEIDILKKTIDVLKKDPGVNKSPLNNREKAVIVDALKEKYPLPVLIKKLKLAKSSYYYQNKRVSFAKKHKDDYQAVATIFHNNKERYGYRRIKIVLNREGYTLSEKVIRKIMRENGLVVKGRRARKYCSYKGEISPEVPNVIQRNFRADKPNQKWLTDVTEFSIPAGKVYLSPIIDCYDGMPVAWNISCKPDAQLVNRMLDRAISALPQDAHPIIHSDRGCHYRWPGWIDRTRKAGLIRSMSQKGCSPDNSACEGFFGRMKNEMFYGRSWQGITVEDFMQQIEAYMVWYRDTRIKISLGGLSPAEYRIKMGLAI